MLSLVAIVCLVGGFIGGYFTGLRVEANVWWMAVRKLDIRSRTQLLDEVFSERKRA